MKHFHRVYSGLAIGSLVFALSVGSASAQDPNAVAQRLKDSFGAQGVQLNWTSVTANGAQVVLEGVTYGAPGMPEAFNVGQVTLDGVTETNGGYTIGTVSFPAVNFTSEGLTVTTTSATLSGMHLPAAGETDFVKSMMVYDSGKIDRMEVKQGDKQVVLIENTNFTMTPPTSGILSFTGAAEKVSADLSTIPDPQTQAIVAALGYQQITGNVQMAGSWNTTDGRLELSKYDMAVDNAGKIGVTFDIGGYTPEVAKALQDTSKAMAENPNADPSAQGMAMMGLMQQMVFNGASIRFEDDSITNKALGFVAQQQGADPAQLKEQTKTIIPFLLASSPIKDDALKQSIAAAVSAYMDNPKSLTIRVKPATPQPFMVIAAQGQADPASLTSVLGVTVTAND